MILEYRAREMQYEIGGFSLSLNKKRLQVVVYIRQRLHVTVCKVLKIYGVFADFMNENSL